MDQYAGAAAFGSPRVPIWQRRDLALVVLCVAVYLLTGAGFVHNTDGKVVFALTKSLVDGHTLAISPIIGAVPGPDGVWYSPYNPGLSFLAVPFYLLGKALTPLVPSFSEFTAADFVVSTMNALITAATVWLIYRLAVVTTDSEGAALATGAAYGFGTMAWNYSRSFFTEPATGFCVALSLFLLMRSRRAVSAWPWVAGAGLAAGAALLMRVTAAVFVPGLLVYLVFAFRTGRRHTLWLALVFLGFYAVSVAAILDYNYLRFGHFAETGYTTGYAEAGAGTDDQSLAEQHIGYLTAVSPARLASFGYALYGLLISPGKGLFLYAPLLVLAVAGLPGFARRHRLEATAIGILAGALLLFHAWLDLGYWFGGWSWGPRYLLPVLPLAMLPAAECFSRLLRSRRGRWIAALAFAAGIVMQLPSVVVSDQNHYVRVTTLEWAPRDADEGMRLFVGSWRYSPYFGQWREAAIVTQRILAGRSVPQGRLNDMSAGQPDLDQLEVFNTYHIWWFRLLWSGRLHGTVRLAVVLAAGGLTVAAALALAALFGVYGRVRRHSSLPQPMRTSPPDPRYARQPSGL